MASGKECVLATGFSLTGGGIDLKLGFENDVVDIGTRMHYDFLLTPKMPLNMIYYAVENEPDFM